MNICQECQGSNLERLAWVDQEGNVINDSQDAEDGKYWCNNCNAHYEGYYEKE